MSAREPAKQSSVVGRLFAGLGGVRVQKTSAVHRPLEGGVVLEPARPAARSVLRDSVSCSLRQLRRASRPLEGPVMYLPAYWFLEEEVALWQWLERGDVPQPDEGYLLGEIDEERELQVLETVDALLATEDSLLDMLLPKPRMLAAFRLRRSAGQEQRIYVVLRDGGAVFRAYGRAPDVRSSTSLGQMMETDRLFPSVRWSDVEKAAQDLRTVGGAGALASALISGLPMGWLPALELAELEVPRAVVSFETYKAWFTEGLQPRVRVLWMGPRGDEKLVRVRLKANASGVRPRTGAAPRWDEILCVESNDENRWPWSVLYYPEERIRRMWRRRVRFQVAGDELVQVDAISPRVVEHLLLARSERRYLPEMYRLFSSWWRAMRLEVAQDAHVARAAISRADEKTDVWRALRCVRRLKWAGKYPDDEAERVRIVARAAAKGDVEDDPDRLLDEEANAVRG